MWCRTSSLLLCIVAACGGPDRRTLDVCGRGDRDDLAVALAGGTLELEVLDGAGNVIAEATAPADRPEKIDLDLGGGARVRVTGKGSGGVAVASGETSLSSGDACVCLALDAQAAAACDGLTCRLVAGECRFFDGDAPAGSRAVDVAVDDTTLREAQPDTAFGSDAIVASGAGATGLLRFALEAIPRTAIVEEATLELHSLPDPAPPGGPPIGLHRMLAPWSEADATWANTQGVAPDPEPLARFFPDRPGGVYDVGVTESIVGWVAMPETNAGVAMVGEGTPLQVDSSESGPTGPRLSVRFHLPDDLGPTPDGGSLCGNGLLDPGEACDDADGDDLDGCTNACVLARCGDGLVRAGVEECDDGNTADGDGCTSACLACDDPNAAATLVGPNGRCYAYYTTNRAYAAAEAFCDAIDHGTLANFETAAEKNAVVAGLSLPAATEIWIGLSDRSTNGTFQWQYGQVLAYDAWAPMEPSAPPDTDQDCVSITGGKYADRPCGGGHPFVCERDGWTAGVDGAAYRPVVGVTVDFREALLRCAELGGHMVTIGDAAEDDLVGGLMEWPLWLGLAELGHEGTLEWVTGEAIVYEQFTGTPNLDGGEWCVELPSQGADWALLACSGRFRRYVCESR